MCNHRLNKKIYATEVVQFEARFGDVYSYFAMKENLPAYLCETAQVLWKASQVEPAGCSGAGDGGGSQNNRAKISLEWNVELEPGKKVF